MHKKVINNFVHKFLMILCTEDSQLHLISKYQIWQYFFSLFKKNISEKELWLDLNILSNYGNDLRKIITSVIIHWPNAKWELIKLNSDWINPLVEERNKERIGQGKKRIWSTYFNILLKIYYMHNMYAFNYNENVICRFETTCL